MMELARLDDWEDRLSQWFLECAGSSFQWGRLDCLLFAAGGVKAVTGVDPGKGHRGKYKSFASANRYLRSIGFESSEAFLDDKFPRVPCASARRGDLVMVDENTGICIGRYGLFMGEEDGLPGLVRLDFAKWRAAWGIG